MMLGNPDLVEIMTEGSQANRSSEGFRKDTKLALPAVSSFPIHKLDGVDKVHHLTTIWRVIHLFFSSSKGH